MSPKNTVASGNKSAMGIPLPPATLLLVVVKSSDFVVESRWPLPVEPPAPPGTKKLDISRPLRLEDQTAAAAAERRLRQQDQE